MLTLPLLPPQHQSPSSPFLPSHSSHRSRSASPPATHPHQPRRTQHHRDARSHPHPLTLLTADELAIQSRKTSIRNFGSFWLRPPGVPKTLQAMHEEEMERLEAEEAGRQEQGLLDLRARQELEEVQGRAAAEGEEGEGERDLDDEVPEAEQEESFNEESLVEGSSLLVPPGGVEEEDEEEEEEALELAELTGAPRDEADLGIERDLDDSVPEAGSYQHTDTEAEEDSSTLLSPTPSSDDGEESGLQDSLALQSARRSGRASARHSAHPLQPQQPGLGLGTLQERMRAQVGAANDASLTLMRSPGSLDLGSSVLESSFVGSSPVLQRGAVQGGRGGRGGVARRRGRRGRMS